MIYNLTSLKVCDNSGIKVIKCFKVYNSNYGGLGTLLKGSVKKTKTKSKVQRGAIVKSVIIRKKKITDRKTGNFISFDSNDALVLNEKLEILSTRVFGPLPIELRKKSYSKLLSLTSILI